MTPPMNVVVGGTSLNHSQTHSEAVTVSTGVKRLTSAGGAWRVAVDMHSRAIGPKSPPMARVASRARRSSSEGSAGTTVIRKMQVAATATTRVRGSSGYRRQITRLTAKLMMASRATSSPAIPSAAIDPPTITTMPIRVRPMARQVRIEVRSWRAIRARTAAKMGPEAMMATTLDAAVRVTAVRNDVVPTALSSPVTRSGRRHRVSSRPRLRPIFRTARLQATGEEKRPTMKAIVQPSTSESRSATRTNRASVETRNIPVKASSRPRGRPDRGIRSLRDLSVGDLTIAGR